jgi:hypothetical protein
MAISSWIRIVAVLIQLIFFMSRPLHTSAEPMSGSMDAGKSVAVIGNDSNGEING